MADQVLPDDGIDRNELIRNLRQIRSMLSLSLEAGLGDRQESRQPIEAAITSIHGAREALSAGRLAESESRLIEAWNCYRQAVWHRGRIWRLSRLAPGLLVYQVVVLGLILGGATHWWPESLNGFLPRWGGKVWIVPAAAFGFGALGAVLRSLYWLGRKVSLREYRSYAAVSHVGAPFVGALFGGLVYLLVEAGLVALDGPSGGQIENKPVPLALAFLVGFRWQSLLAWIESFRFRGSAEDQSAQPPPTPNSDDSAQAPKPNAETGDGAGDEHSHIR